MGFLYIGVFSTWSYLQIVLKVPEGEVMDLPNKCFMKIGPSLREQKLSV